MENINHIIKNNNLSVSVSTPIKLILNYKKISKSCYYKKIPDLESSDNCEYCKKYREDIGVDDVLCRKHYALDILNNDKNLKLLKFNYMEKEFMLFGRYILFNNDFNEDSYNLIYVSPLHISKTKFCPYVIPKNAINFNSLNIYDIGSLLENSKFISFDMSYERFFLDFSNPNKIVLTKAVL